MINDINSESEWFTRKNRIDAKLKSLNPPWVIIKFSPFLDINSLTNHAVEEFPTDNGPADYALFVNGKLLGILEAKRVTVDPQNVLEQAKRYSKGIKTKVGKWKEFGVPFLFSSNGEFIWFIDVRNPMNLSRRISNFFTSNALEELFNQSEITEQTFSNLNIENTRLRPYQNKAIAAIENALVNRHRKMLIAMATGTGKTFTLVSLIYRLLETKHFRRILFLVDRRALAVQAVREFTSFDTPAGNKFNQEYELYSQRFRKEDFDESDKFDSSVLPNEYLTNPDNSKTFVYVSTIQRMTVNLFGWDNSFQQDPNDPDYEEEADELETPIPIHAFDLIIADECHRGYTAKEEAIWRNTLDHFDAIKIGLTATPALHTTAYFGAPVYRYTTEEAIKFGYLVDYEAVRINSNVLMNGAFLKEGERVGVIDPQKGSERLDNLEDEREFTSSQIEKDITSPDTNKKIIEEIASYAYKHETESGHFPKILIFACNDIDFISHSEQLVTICKQVFNRGDDFVAKITGNKNVDRPLQKIREFRNRPNPKIVVSVDMLSTGVDIPAIEYIVFLRPVKSRILWVQMLGRGTRLCPDLHKDHFTVFDCFGGTLIEYFKDATEFSFEPPQKESLSYEQIIENIYQNVNRPYYTNVFIKRLRRIEKSTTPDGIRQLSVLVEDQFTRFVGNLENNIRTAFDNTMRIIRNKNFINYLYNYPRPPKEFWKGYDIIDQVTSEEMILGEKPVDYLDSFSKFVKENPEQILAIKILLEKPKDWNPEVLTELRDKLGKNKFTEKDLQRAHKIIYNKSLADIISMVKHAAIEQLPILTAEERVKNAVAKVIKDKHFTYEQNKWIGLIEQHLIQNLSINEADLDTAPAFYQIGGIRKAKKIFGNDELKRLIEELNFNIAA
jgi:type I restriction enzyme R subunit